MIVFRCRRYSPKKVPPFLLHPPTFSLPPSVRNRSGHSPACGTLAPDRPPSGACFCGMICATARNRATVILEKPSARRGGRMGVRRVVPMACPRPSRKERDMARKKLIRRFEPRYSVSQEMLDRESKYVAREHEDYLLGSIDDLRKRLEKLRILWRE